MGRPIVAAVQQQQQIIEGLRRTVAKQELVINYIAKVAGISPQIDAIRRTADIDNPAQPVPNPPDGPPAETTEQAVTPEAYDSPLNPGQTPGSTQNVPADATGTPLDPGATLPTAPYNNLLEVTAPVAGTEEGQVPLEQVRTEVDVRVGDPMNLETAFPWNMGQGQPGGGVTAANRSMASLRLARLRLQAGTAEGSDDLRVAASIEADASLSNEAIESEITTLAGVVKAAGRRSQRPAGVVPKAASVQRTTPSLVQQPGLTAEASMATDGDAEDIFLS